MVPAKDATGMGCPLTPYGQDLHSFFFYRGAEVQKALYSECEELRLPVIRLLKNPLSFMCEL
jgi:hypothetical protein